MTGQLAGAPQPAGRLFRLTAAIRRWLAARVGGTSVPFRIVFSDGTDFHAGDGAPAFTITFRTRRGEIALARYGHVGLLESYFDGEVDVDGNFALAFRAAFDAGFDEATNPLVSVRNRWHELNYSNRSIDQAKANARAHYGFDKRFYEPWLDRIGMLYTCAYWQEGTTSLEQAQLDKMHHVCRKARLAPGETFVDVGCGWGGLLFHALEHYGARGTGINTTTEQVDALQHEIGRRGLAGSLSVVECDFREIPGQYDKLLSIGTLEHAGRDQLDAVVRAHAQALKPGGLGVIHFIGHVGETETEFYIREHIFPGGWIPSLARALEAMETNGLEILDVENLRRHYALTLDSWAERFDRAWHEIRLIDPARFDERFRRKWRTYLWSCAELFRARQGRTHLFQVVVSKGNVADRYPMTRDFLYRPAA